MKNTQMKSKNKWKIQIIFPLLLLCIGSFAQQNLTTCKPSGNVGAQFSYGIGSCNQNISIYVEANQVGTHSWSIRFSNNPQVFNKKFSGNSMCVPVPVTGLYSIEHTHTSNNNVTNTSTCDISVMPFNPVDYVSTPDVNGTVVPITNKDVGAIKGSNSVSLTGGSTYTIPVALPKGTRGVEPSLNIDYNSQSGIGLMGMGWNFSALSSIVRTNKDYYNDDKPSAPQLGTDDAYALDGNKLVLLTGDYGQNKSTYGTKNETFSRITLYVTSSVTGPDYFLVETKTGSKLYYGNSIDSKITNGKQNAGWFLKKSEDPFGNYMTYNYSKNNDVILLTKISYTGNEILDIKPYNTIEFSYKDRKDVNVGYIAGIGVESSSLLDNITIKADGNLHSKYEFTYAYDDIHSYLGRIDFSGADGKYVPSTLFTYGKNDQKFKITTMTIPPGPKTQEDYRIGDFNGDGLTDFLYSETSNGYYRSFRSYLNEPNTDKFKAMPKKDLKEKSVSVYKTNMGIGDQVNFLAQDYNGDGLDDAPIVRYEVAEEPISFISGYDTNEEPIYSTYQYQYHYIKDMNIYRSKGTGDFLDADVFDMTANVNGNLYRCIPGKNGGTFDYLKKSIFTAGDFDGDSKADYLSLLSNVYDDRIFVSFPYNGILNQEVLCPSNPYFANEFRASSVTQSIDFDGDGKSDLAIFTEKTIKVYKILFDVTGYIAEKITEFKVPDTNNPFTLVADIPGAFRFADFNGDKKTDLLLTRTVIAQNGDLTQTKYRFETYFSTGKVFWPVSEFTKLASEVSTLGADFRLFLGDFDGNGMSDIGFQTKVRAKQPHGLPDIEYYNFDIFYSSGKAFTEKIYLTPPNPPNAYFFPEIALLGDFNGDGKSDLIAQDRKMYSFFANTTNQLLASVRDGFNREIKFTYSDATPGGVFTKGAQRAYPYNSVQLPMFLVTTMSAPNGLGGLSTTEYEYSDAVLHRRGIGFLGFMQTTAKNLLTGTTSVSKFSILSSTNQKGIANDLLEVDVFKTNGQGAQMHISKTEYTKTLVDVGNGRIWSRLDNEKSTDYTTGVETNQHYEKYDDFGNVLKLLASTNIDVQTSTTTVDYEKWGSWIPASPVFSTIVTKRKGATAHASVSRMRYDTKGNMYEQITSPGTTQAVTTNTEYYDVGLPKSTTVSAQNVKSKTESYIYDSKFRFVTESTNPLGQKTFKSYDARWGKVTSITDINENTSIFGYDGFGRMRSTTGPLDYTIKTDYTWDLKNSNNTNSLYYTSTEHPAAPDSKEYFDVLERSYASEVESFNKTLYSSKRFDDQGNVVWKKNASNVETTFEYDYLYRLKTQTNGRGTTSIDYNYAGGNATTITTPPAGAGHSITTLVDAAGKLLKKTDLGGDLEYDYNSQGSVTVVKLNDKIVSETRYDGITGQKTSFFEPNGGAVTYIYDAFGQMTKQTEVRANPADDLVTEMRYDAFGRIESRTAKEGITKYFYKTTKGGLNAIERVEGFNGIDQLYTYDSYGKVLSMTDNGLTHSYVYDPKYGYLTTETYPSGFSITREYDHNSFLKSVTNNKSKRPLFSALDMDTHGNYSSYQLGNDAISNMTYDDYGQPVNFSTKGIQDLTFDFELTTGNLLSRTDNIKNLSESFTYDDLDRLKNGGSKGTPTFSLEYEDNGNIKNKSDAGLGDYVYDKKGKRNAVMRIDEAMDYGDQSQLIQYTNFHQPDQIVEVSSETYGGLYFTYGADYQRRVMEVADYRCTQLNPDGSSDCVLDVYARRTYSGNYEIDEIAPIDPNNSSGAYSDCPKGALGKTRKIHYIAGGDGICAIYVQTTIGEEVTENIYYTYKDYLGSLLTFTDEKPVILYEQSFDAWGRYRNTEDWSYQNIQGRPRWMYRGYTGHEHLYGVNDINIEENCYHGAVSQIDGHDVFNLINMNGRLYDPVNGRMLSVDELSHDGLGTQGYNRYTYAHNNPLKYTDPDGEHPMLIAMAIGASMGVITNGINNMKSGQKFFKGAGQAALGGAIFGGLTFSFGQIFQGLWLGQALAHGVLGAVQSGASGGSFRSGFMSGIVSSGVSSLVGSVANSLHFNASQTAASMIFAGGVSGGISSHMSGGSFLDGLKQGLMTSSLNHALHMAGEGIAGALEREQEIKRAVYHSSKVTDGDYRATVEVVDKYINSDRQVTYKANYDNHGKFLGGQVIDQNISTTFQNDEMGGGYDTKISNNSISNYGDESAFQTAFNDDNYSSYFGVREAISGDATKFGKIGWNVNTGIAAATSVATAYYGVTNAANLNPWVIGGGALITVGAGLFPPNYVYYNTGTRVLMYGPSTFWRP